LVRSKEAKFWLFRYTRGGKMREMGLGPATGRVAVTLAQARAKARELHAIVREGRDPLDERQAAKAKAHADEAKARAGAITFAQVADMYASAHEAGWRNAKHGRQWRATLRDYAMPVVGALPVEAVDTALVMSILESLWRRKPATASRVRGRVESVLDFAKARGWREGENPARWRGHLDHLLPAHSKVARVKHHPALDWRDAGAFMVRLRRMNGVAARALEFLILTAARSGEVRGARWSEIDLAHGVWTVAGERMKSGRDHRVPLSAPAMAILREVARFGDNGFVFPGFRTVSPLSDVMLTRAVDGAGGDGASVHGFRSTFRDWCAEATHYPRELAEAALAHVVRDQTERAYQRGDALERRRVMMEAWAMFCLREPVASGEVIEFRQSESA
jgi:integrase